MAAGKTKGAKFSTDCTLCPRLAGNLRDIRRTHADYFARPVPPFGDQKGRLMIVGLAPGMHGANRTGRPFTGDYAGILLYETLHAYGFSNRKTATDANDGLKLRNCFITNAVKCLPPENKPTLDEIKTCNHYLAQEIAAARPDALILALGNIAHEAVLRAVGVKKSQYPFSHGGIHELPDGRQLIDSYHCSRYNTQTRRLTPAMFHQVFDTIQRLLGQRM